MLLRVENLHTHFVTPDGPVAAVAGASFELDRGRTLALVGESGCGKSATALSILRLLPRATARIVAGAVHFHHRDLLTLPEASLRAIRGNRIAMIFQEPMTSLNPVLSVGAQLAEVLRLHRGLGGRTGRAATAELLRSVGLPAPERHARQYPHELSGGMRQRVMLAMALACGPELLIADEPTTALDVTLQAQMLALLRQRQRETGLAILFITHDLGLVAEIADTVAVMYAGRIVETAPPASLFAAPRHPYTQALLHCAPRLDIGGPRRRLAVIDGEVPDPRRRPTGCAFHPRCPLGRSDPDCRSAEPPSRPLAPAHACACWKATG